MSDEQTDLTEPVDDTTALDGDSTTDPAPDDPPETETAEETRRRGTVRVYRVAAAGTLAPEPGEHETITAARAWLAGDDHDLPPGRYRPVREFGDLELAEETVVRRVVREVPGE